MDKSFGRYRFENDFRSFMNTNVWHKLERHGFPMLSSWAMERKKYGNRIIHEDEWTNTKISEMIMDDKPCMVARFGLTEMNFLCSYLEDKKGNSRATNDKLVDAMNRLCLLSGFFPNDMSLGDNFAELYFASIPELDLCGVWNLYMEDYILDQYAPKCSLTQLRNLEPWNTDSEVAWSSHLVGKKVLVIHPFQETIEKQYTKHREIFKNKFLYENILPEFELKTVKAVQSLGGENDEYSNWFDALNGMLNQIRSVDFDVAIIGCGAYGLPIAAEIKKMGKKAIHLGGATQLMFGIWGNRWEQIPEIKALYNDSWVRPTKEETPRRANEVEDSCYW